MLIADGDPALCRLLSSRLDGAGLASDCVSEVSDAIERMSDGRYGLLVLDVALPGGSVEDVVARIAAMRPRPVVLALAANPAAARSLDVEVVQVILRKPPHVGQLVEMIGSCLRAAGQVNT